MILLGAPERTVRDDPSGASAYRPAEDGAHGIHSGARMSVNPLTSQSTVKKL